MYRYYRAYALLFVMSQSTVGAQTTVPEFANDTLLSGDTNSADQPILNPCVVSPAPDGLCLQSNAEQSHQLTKSAGITRTRFVDIRPANCNSFFDDYKHTRRGTNIENALRTVEPYKQLTSTSRVFPLVDFYSISELRVVQSRDLLADIYNNPLREDYLYTQLLQEATLISSKLVNKLKELGSISANDGTRITTIEHSANRKIYMDLVIQAGTATEQQIEQLNRAIDAIGQKFGYTLAIIEIP